MRPLNRMTELIHIRLSVTDRHKLATTAAVYIWMDGGGQTQATEFT